MAPRMYRFFGLMLILVQLAGCQRRVPFNPALAERFFPLRSGFTWNYRVTFANGATETIADRVLESDQPVTLGGAALVVSDYSGLDGSRGYSARRPEALSDRNDRGSDPLRSRTGLLNPSNQSRRHVQDSISGG